MTTVRKWLAWRLMWFSELVWNTQRYERIMVLGPTGQSWLEIGVISDSYGGGLISMLNYLPPTTRVQWWSEGQLQHEEGGRGLQAKP